VGNQLRYFSSALGATIPRSIEAGHRLSTSETYVSNTSGETR
jgi:hypothetical protein